MPPRSSPHFLAVLLVVLDLAVQNYSQDALFPFVTACSGLSFTSSSPYETKLHRVLTDLIASTPNNPSYFSLINSTIPPQVIGLAQCRPDISPALCTACLNQSAATLNTLWLGCGLIRSGSIRSRSCLLRYADEMFYNDLNTQIIYIDRALNASASFNRRVQDLMKTLIAKTAEAELRFSVGVSKESAVAVDIYGMGWCLIELVSSDCARCLNIVLERIAGKQRGVATIISCQVRFETYSFFASSLIAMPPAPVEAEGQRTDRAKKIILMGTFTAAALFLIFALLILLPRRRRNIKLTPLEIEQVENQMIVDVDILVIDFGTLSNATDNFSEENKLGQGGFGPVYKGILKSGQEIAVKRLSKSSVQGLSEMRNEVHFVAKLQHKNLVKLLGYCLEGDEKLLVYEYLPNGSLHKLLFSPAKSVHLSWKTRLMIIEGIGRGLLYLHEDSHLRVIHRDIKASNVLLDGNMNPKISDFGLAKLFDADDTHKNTRRISGTYGYMAPEYALRGRYSTKSDVFSYGVLILEIITGRKNSSFQEADLALGLPSYVWRRWNEGMGLQVVDQSLGDGYQPQDMLRCIQIGLLCVQEDQAQRPSMATLVLMHSANSIALPTPRRPAFYVHAVNDLPASLDEATISAMEG